MKTTRKILALLMALTLCLAIAAPAFADIAADGSITIDNAIVGESYTLYKIFELTYGTGGTQNSVTVPEGDEQNAIAGTYQPVSYSYTKGGNDDQFFAALQGATTLFELSQVGSSDVYNVVRKASALDADIISFMKANISKLPVDRMIGTQVASGETVTWNNLVYGYYYATSSAGSLVSIDSTLKDATIKEKNIIPTDDKEIKVSATNTWGTSDNAQIGNTVDFRLTITDGKGTDGYIILHDAMSNGLTLKVDSFVVTKGGTAVDPANYKIYVDSGITEYYGEMPASIDHTVDLSETDITDGAATNPKTLHVKDSDTFVIIFDHDYVNTLSEGDVIYVTYQAILNDAAVVGTDETNTSHISYSNQTSQNHTVTVKTYDVDILKYANDATTVPIADAVFQLQKEDGTRIWLTPGTAVTGFDVYEVAENQNPDLSGLTAVYDTRDPAILIGYKNAQNEMVLYNAFVTTAGNKVRIDGLDVDVTYKLDELEAPSGYNKLLDKETVTATGSPLDFADVNIQNLSGTELPSTGGIGTTIFIIAGSVLVLGAGIILVAMSVSKRRSEEN